MSFLTPQSRAVIAPPRGTNKLWERLAIATNWPVLVAVGVLSALGVLSIWEDKKFSYLKLARLISRLRVAGCEQGRSGGRQSQNHGENDR